MGSKCRKCFCGWDSDPTRELTSYNAPRYPLPRFGGRFVVGREEEKRERERKRKKKKNVRTAETPDRFCPNL